MALPVVRRLDFIGDDAVRRDCDLAFKMRWTYNGDGIDLTGHVLELKIRKADGSGSPFVVLDNAGNGGIVLDDQVNPGTRGGAFYRLPNGTIVSTLKPGRYSYTARDTSAGGITPMWIGFMDFEGPAS